MSNIQNFTQILAAYPNSYWLPDGNFRLVGVPLNTPRVVVARFSANKQVVEAVASFDNPYQRKEVGAGQGGPTYTAGDHIAISATNEIATTGLAEEDDRFSLITTTDPAAPRSALVWRYIGSPSAGNVSLGAFDPNTTVGTDMYRCTFGTGLYYCAFGNGMQNCTFGNTQIDIKTGEYCTFNTLDDACQNVYLGDDCSFNRLGKSVGVVRMGNRCVGNVLANDVAYVFLGIGVKNCTIGAGCNAVELGDGCERVELYNCGGAGYTNTAPFVVPAGTTDAVYRNNVLVSTAIPAAPLPVIGIVGGVEKGYADLAAAFADQPTALFLHADVEVSTVIGGSFFGKFFGNGHTVDLTATGVLRFSRYASLYQLNSTGAGAIRIVGGGATAGSTVPAADECVQLIDCNLESGLELSALTSYQGLALRGKTVVENLTAGGGPVYLYDLAQVSQPLPAGFTVHDRRPGAAGAPGTGTGIDYANPVTLSAAATLSANKAYYLEGAGYALTLPSASANLGAAIYVEVAATAAGLYAVGPQLLRASESLIVRATPGGWAISTKQLVPLVARIETTLSQQDAFAAVFFVPFSTTVQDAVGMSTAPGITIRRSGQYILTTGGALKNASGTDQNVISLLANPGAANEQLLVSNGTAITSGGIGDPFVTYTGYLEAGTVLRTRFYCGAGAALRGQYAGAQIFLTVTEIA